MKVFIPYTEQHPATDIALWDYDPEYARIYGKYGYGRFFADRWKEGAGFVNVEHDVVPWPGAIELLTGCPQPWCGFAYTDHRWDEHPELVHGVPLGCMKIGAELIAATPDIWKQIIDWSHCDVHLFAEARKAGFWPHQHFPGVVNANNALLARRRV